MAWSSSTTGVGLLVRLLLATATDLLVVGRDHLCFDQGLVLRVSDYQHAVRRCPNAVKGASYFIEDVDRPAIMVQIVNANPVVHFLLLRRRASSSVRGFIFPLS